MGLVVFTLLIHYYNLSLEKKWIIIVQILITYILHIEIQIPAFDFAHPIYYAYLICKNKLKLWLLCTSLMFIAFYCVVRLYYEFQQELLWTIIHYATIYLILVLMYCTSSKFSEDSKSKLQMFEVLQNSERCKWKEMSQHEQFQDHYTKYLCFNQIREGVILYEQGFDHKPTFINQAAKQMFSIQDDTILPTAFSNYYKIDKVEARNSIQSIKSIGNDRQNSIFKQQSGSISQNSKAISLFQRASSCKDVNFSQMLEKAWHQTKKETYLFYIQSCKPGSQSQFQPIYEISVYINNSVKRIMTVICRDLSYKKYIQQLEAHNHQKSKMISFVSHEFRAPLGCMINMLEHVAKQQSNPYIQTSIDNSKYLLNLCNDLLDLAQIQANKFQLKTERFNLKKLCQECFQMYALQAEKKQLKLLLQYHIDCPTIIESDPSRIKQIIINLIGNAFKFTQEGHIAIEVEMNSENTILISVSDTGLGVQEKDQELLMKAFGKINSEESKKLNAQGVGLGLVISNKIAQQLGDGLVLKSVYHKGSKFSFTITPKEAPSCEQGMLNSVNNQKYELRDCDSGENLDNAESSKEIQVTITQPKKSIIQEKECCSKILIVDDSNFNIEVLQMLLSKIGINQTDQTINGYQAIEKIQTKKQCNFCHLLMYKLIFMDLEMPGINGINAAKSIFEFCEDGGIDLPIIVACSGYTRESEFPKCQQVGMKFYLEKPVQIEYLLPIIKHFRSL